MSKKLGLLVVCVLGVSGLASASMITGSTTVDGSDDIYYAGQTQPSDGQLGTVPTAIISLSGNDFVTFADPVNGSGVTGTDSCPSVSLSGCITINSGGNLNDADGNGAGTSQSIETGANGISGMSAPGGGYLVGVFLDGTTPIGAAPANLDFTTGPGTSFTSLNPLLDQAFFIGDGLTGDGTGSVQQFYVPTGATELVLGISDACNYNGSPGCYLDNSGTFNVTYNLDSPNSATPEPASVLMFLGGLGLVAATRRKLARR